MMTLTEALISNTQQNRVLGKCSLRSMAVLSSRAQERRSREKNKNQLLPPQSPRGFSALARLYYLARPTKTAMLRRLRSELNCLN